NRSNNVVVEFGQFFGRDPIFSAFAASHFVRLILVDVGPEHSETKDITNVSRVQVFDVPIAGNADGVVFCKHRIKKRLGWQSRREPLPSGITNEVEFFLANRPEQHDSFLSGHGNRRISSGLGQLRYATGRCWSSSIESWRIRPISTAPDPV